MALAVNGSGTIFKKCDRSNPPSRLEQGLRVFHLSAYVRYPRALPARPGCLNASGPGPVR